MMKKLKNKLKNLFYKYSFKNIYSYVLGNLRYKVFYSKNKFVLFVGKLILPTHIKEQIVTRINSMDKECYMKGQCKICGCKTTALQMANKACDKPCYPRMLYYLDWKYAKTYEPFYCQSTKKWWKLDKRWNKFRIVNIKD